MKPATCLVQFIFIATLWLSVLSPLAQALTVTVDSAAITVDTRDKVQLSVGYNLWK